MSSITKRNRWQIWRDVIIALFVREIKTGFNDKFGVSWSVIGPLVFIFVISFIRGRMAGDDVHGMPVFSFMAVGFLTFFMFQESMSAAMSAVKKASSLLVFRQVLPISPVISAGLFALLSKLVTFVIIAVIMYFLHMELRVDNLLGLILILLDVWLWSVAIGLVVGIAAAFVPEVSKLWSLMTRPMLFISCVFFSINDLPHEYWQYFYWNPLAQGVELVRHSMYTNYPPGPMEVSFLAIFTVVTVAASLIIYQATWKKTLSGLG